MRWIKITCLVLFVFFCFPNQILAAGTWVEDTDGWKYQEENGTSIKNQWSEIDGNWYYFNKSGYMVTGHRRINGEYYFFSEAGVMITGWFLDEDKEQWFYFNDDGTRYSGWLFYEDAWYHFTSSGVMSKDGYRSVGTSRYYFYDNGQMAANQYVGTYYIDENGKRDSRYDMVIYGDRKPTVQEKDQITEALKNVPRKWIKAFVEDGWKMMYYTEKSFFSAPDTEIGVYYLYHKLDIDYKKLKFINPTSLTRAMGEYVGYEAGLYRDDSQFAADFYLLLDTLPASNPLPGYFQEDIKAQFGVVFEEFIHPEWQEEFELYAGELFELMEKTVGTRPKKRVSVEEDEQDQIRYGPGWVSQTQEE